jgi:hypothetical protein
VVPLQEFCNGEEEGDEEEGYEEEGYKEEGHQEEGDQEEDFFDDVVLRTVEMLVFMPPGSATFIPAPASRRIPLCADRTALVTGNYCATIPCAVGKLRTALNSRTRPAA